MPRYAIHSFGGLTWLLIVSTACRDEILTTRPNTAAPPRPQPVSVKVNDPWDTFSADVRVQTTRLDGAGTETLRQHPVQYHIERQLKGKNWSLVLTFSSRGRAVMTNMPNGMQPERLEAMRFEDAGDGTSPRVYDGSGRLIPMRLPPLAESLKQLASGPGASRPFGASAMMGPGIPRPATSDRQWINTFVLAGDGKANRIASLSRQFGAARRTSAGMDRYVTVRDSVRLTVDVDPSIGAVVAMTEDVRGSTRRRWNLTYDKTPDGTAMKSQVRVESAMPDGKGSRISVTTISNVRFDRRLGS
jgi:hypothetical protein